MTSLAAILIVLIGMLVAYVALRPFVRTYRTYRGTRVITCPETGKPAAVEVDVRLAVASQASMGTPAVQLTSCSRWPERRACGQACLAQIEAAPHDCLARSILQRWYAGKYCVFCHRPFGDIHWSDHKPAARLATGQTIQWAEIRPAELLVVLADSLPVCWSCHIAETFRRQHRDLVLDDPPARPHAG